MSFSLSTSHHGLNTAPDGDFFNNNMNFSTDSADITLAKLEIASSIEDQYQALSEQVRH